MFHSNHNSSDSLSNVDDAIQHLLPEIQISVKEELLKQIQEELDQQIEEQIAEIQSQALHQYNEASLELQNEAENLKQEKTSTLASQISILTARNQKLATTHFNHLQEKFIAENFQDQIMGHETIGKLEETIYEELLKVYSKKIEEDKNRKQREILVRLQKKQQKERINRDKVIKHQIFGKAGNSSGIEDLKKDIEMLKVGIASMRSQYNIKMKKADEQIKDLKKKIKEKQQKESMEELLLELQVLKNKQNREQNSEILQQKYEDSSFSRNFSHLDSSSDFSIFKNQPITDIRFIADEKNVIESEGDQEDSSNTEKQAIQNAYQTHLYEYSRQYPTNFKHNNLQQVLCPDSDNQSEEQVIEGQKSKILCFDVGHLLRANWQHDPLEEYITPISNNENSNTGNISQNISNKNGHSNFHDKYMLYLQSLNKNSKLSMSNGAKKGSKQRRGLLSRTSKQAIIKKIAKII